MAGLGGGGGGGAGAIRFGRAYVEAFLNDNQVIRSLSKLKARFAGLGTFLTRTGAIGAAAGAGILAPITALFKGGADRASQIGDLAAIFGGTTESVSRMAYAFQVAGGSLEELEMAMSRLGKIDQSGRPFDEVFIETVNALNDMPAGFERNKQAAEIFGRSYARILDVGQDLRRLMDEAPLVSKEDAARAEEFNQSFAAMKVQVQSALVPLLEFITPIVQRVKEWVVANAEIARTIAIVGAGLLAAGLAAVKLGFAITGISAGISVAVGLVGALLTPLGLAGAALAGIGALFLTQTESGQEFAGSLKAGFLEAAETAKTAFAGISDAIKAGDIGLAFEIALTGLRLEWAKVVAFWTEKWNKFKGIFVDGWHEMTTFASMVLIDVAAGAEKAFEMMAVTIGNAFRWIAEQILTAAIKIAEALDSLDPTDSLVDAIEEAKRLRDSVGEGARQAHREESERNLEEIARERDALQEELMQAHVREQEARRRAREADLDAARGDIRALEERLRMLNAQAAAAAVLAAKPAPAPVAKIPTAPQLADSVKGAFATPFAARQFGIGSDMDVKKNVKATAQNTAETAKTLLQLVTSLRFH